MKQQRDYLLGDTKMRYTEKIEDTFPQQWNVDKKDYSSVRAILDSEIRSLSDACIANGIWSFHN